MKKWLSVLVMLVLATSVYAQDMPLLVNQGLAAYKAGNYKLAINNFTKAAQAGDTQAQANLGVVYSNGEAVKPDFSKALYWLNKAVKKNVPSAYYNLAQMYLQGTGVRVNNEKAINLLVNASSYNYAPAQEKLASIYMLGKSTKQDLVQAYKWYSLAALQGDKTSSNMLVVLSKQMTKEQLSQANKLVQQFKEKKKIAD